MAKSSTDTEGWNGILWSARFAENGLSCKAAPPAPPAEQSTPTGQEIYWKNIVSSTADQPRGPPGNSSLVERSEEILGLQKLFSDFIIYDPDVQSFKPDWCGWWLNAGTASRLVLGRKILQMIFRYGSWLEIDLRSVERIVRLIVGGEWWWRQGSCW